MDSPRPSILRWPLRRRAAQADDRPPGDIRCRNCGADAAGAYCPACGQETRIALPNATQFLRDAAGRYVAIDGRMWRTLVPLLARPGFLTREYLDGRRRRYIRPARLVLVLALLLFAVARCSLPDDILEASGEVAAGAERAPAPPGPPASSKPAATSDQGRTPRVVVDTGNESRVADAVVSFDGEPLHVSLGGLRFDVDEDFSIRVDPASVAGSPIGERIARRLDAYNRLERTEKAREIVAGMLRYGPYALVALLPAFALMMQALYPLRSARHPRRPRRYAEHLIFGAHNHAFVALVVALVVIVPWVPVAGLLSAWPLAYLPLSMRAVYGGGAIGVLARSLVIAVAYAALFVVALLGLLFAAVVLR